MMRTYDTYELHRWLLKITKCGCDEPYVDELVDLQVKHAKELIELRQNPLPVPDDMLRAAIELAHVLQGAEGLTRYSEYMRGMADAIDERVMRGKIKVVSRVGKPANEE